MTEEDYQEAIAKLLNYRNIIFRWEEDHARLRVLDYLTGEVLGEAFGLTQYHATASMYYYLICNRRV